MREVVVTGVGAVTPLGVGARPMHERWAAGVCAIEDGEGRCSAYDPAEHLSRKEARRADRCTQLARVSAAEAIADAGWDADAPPYDPDEVGCMIGTGIGGIQTLESSHGDLLERGPGAVGPLSIPLMMSNAPAAAVALRHDLRGPTFGVVSACAAGAHAIGTAVRAIQHGDARAIVCGGAEAAITPLSKSAFAAMSALSPTGVSRPFDARRDGFVMGEGAGVLVLEDKEAALARGARILGTVRGYGATSDAHHLTAPEPEGAGAARAIRLALRDAGLDASGVDYVNAHGTSTPLNDRAETRALEAALGDRAREIPVSSLKSSIGHLLGAAGAVEAVATLLALGDRVAPPTIGFAEREEGMELDYVPDSARPLEVPDGRAPVGISDSFGFGGHNAVLCLEAA
ncbi:MAG TPA: beta-ketoacyl-ACP synthase II [Baekduia sp.]|nr:beta-ketoacyl-ACP synthase II [Baekduia sp.]